MCRSQSYVKRITCIISKSLFICTFNAEIYCEHIVRFIFFFTKDYIDELNVRLCLVYCILSVLLREIKCVMTCFRKVRLVFVKSIFMFRLLNG